MTDPKPHSQLLPDCLAQEHNIYVYTHTIFFTWCSTHPLRPIAPPSTALTLPSAMTGFISGLHCPLSTAHAILDQFLYKEKV